VPGADLAGVHFVVAEVVVRHVAIFIADQPVALHRLRVELDLNLGVPGNRQQRAGEFVHKDALGLLHRIDVGVEAVAVVGQLLHQRVVVVAHAQADCRQLMPSAACSLITAECHRPSRPDIRHAVGKQHDTVGGSGSKFSDATR
jgi:hypothetical protein